MYRIDNSTAAITLPAPSAPGPQPNSYFTGGNPTGGVPATIVEAEWLNMTQEEIANVILAAGIVLNKGDRTQLLQALRNLARRRLSTPLNLYVSPTGSDTSGDGMSTGTAWATPQYAWQWMLDNLDPGGQFVTVNIAPGNYTAMSLSGTIPGCQDQSIIFLGNTSNPSLTTISGVNLPAIAVSDASVAFKGLTVTATGLPSGSSPGGIGLLAGQGGRIYFDHINFAACGVAHMASENGEIWATGTGYTISGSALYHLEVTSSGLVAVSNQAVTITGNPNFSAFCYVTSCGVANNWGCAFTGAATGKRWQCLANGVININGVSPDTYYPGNAVGSAATGGQVI